MVQPSNGTRGKTSVESRSSGRRSVVVSGSQNGILSERLVQGPRNVESVSGRTFRDSVREEETLVRKNDKVSHSLQKKRVERTKLECKFEAKKKVNETYSVLVQVVVISPSGRGIHGLDGNARVGSIGIGNVPQGRIPAV